MRRKVPLPVQALTYLLLFLGAVAAAFPFYWMIISAFKLKADLFVFPPKLWPYPVSLDSFARVITEAGFLRNLGNSVLVSVVYTALSVFLCALGGYAFAKYRFPGRNAMFAVMLGTMMLPFEVTIIPLFFLMIHIGWQDSFLAVTIPFAASAWGIFLMSQALRDIPDDLIDAARIDGCSEFGIFWRVVLPVSKPAVAALAILSFLSAWNDYLWPLIILNGKEAMTAPVALGLLKQGYFTDYAAMMAGSVLSAVPMLILFVVLQKFFIEGALFGAIKG